MIDVENSEIHPDVFKMFSKSFASADGGTILGAGMKVTKNPDGTFTAHAGQAEKPEFEPLAEAARRVLEATLGSMIGEMAMSEPTPERRLDWFGVWIGEMKGVSIYGKRPPSQRYELIPPDKFAELRVVGGAKELYETWGGAPAIYVDLAVKCADMEAHWQDLIL